MNEALELPIDKSQDLQADLQIDLENRTENSPSTGTLGDLIADLTELDRPALEPQNTIPAEPILPPLEPQTIESTGRWFLGLDIGTTGISAVLLNRSSGQLYPIYWHQPPSVDETGNPTPEQREERAIDKQFRLPLAVSLSAAAEEDGSAFNSLIRDFKPYLDLALPYDRQPLETLGRQTLSGESIALISDQSGSSEPILSWSATQPIALMTLRQSLQALLAPLTTEHSSTLLQCGAVNLPLNFSTVMQQLEGIGVSLPTGWSDAYRFNVREALLAAQIAQRPEQILFLEESIATLLAAFAGSSQSPVLMPQGQAQHDIEWQGNTLILCAGATQTELTLVHLPDGAARGTIDSNPATSSELNHANFHSHTLPYAGSAIDQDIVTRLLYPLLAEDDPIRSALATVGFPAVGEPDLLKREIFQQQLRQIETGLEAGRSLLETARALKLHLQQQNRYVVHIAEEPTTILRQDLTTQVLLPYVQRLNRELNALLNQTQIPALSVRQVICTGGTASLGAITRWLQQKLPNALILQDAYPWVRSDCIPTCSRVAYGLAALPFYLSVGDRSRHQYSDFFLLRELIRDFPHQAMTLEEILERLQQRGFEADLLNAEPCRSRILSILEGQLPAGLVPVSPNSSPPSLTPASQQNLDYRAIIAKPLFRPETYPEGKAYRIDRAQLDLIDRYCELLFRSTHPPMNYPDAIPMRSV